MSKEEVSSLNPPPALFLKFNRNRKKKGKWVGPCNIDRRREGGALVCADVCNGCRIGNAKIWGPSAVGQFGHAHQRSKACVPLGSYAMEGAQEGAKVVGVAAVVAVREAGPVQTERVMERTGKEYGGDELEAPSIDVDMLHPRRKRTIPTESIVLEGVTLGDSVEKNAQSSTATPGVQLAIVPLGSSPVSPPPKRDPKRNKSSVDGKDSTSSSKNTLAGPLEGPPSGPMNALVWNCHGAGNVATIHEIHELAKKFTPTLLCIIETQIEGSRCRFLRTYI